MVLIIILVSLWAFVAYEINRAPMMDDDGNIID